MAIDDLVRGRVSGQPLRALARMTRNPAVGQVALRVFTRELGLDALPGLIDRPLALEPDIAPRRARATRPRPAPTLAAPRAPDWATTSARLTAAFAAGESDPEATLEQLYAAADELAARQPFLRCVLERDESAARAAARDAAARYRAGRPLGPLDGVPVLVKEQIAVRGLPHRVGGAVGDASPARADAALVARLRAAGCVIAGQTAMTELGMSPLGVNPCRPPLRNPHHLERVAGGSSTGAGVAVATGLVPLAVGADGGGSIRIPAALCGVFGLKPTYGRVPRTGDAFSGSVNHVGPLGACTAELAHFLDATCGPDAGDPASQHAPTTPAPFCDALRRGVAGMRVGVDRAQWQRATPAVREAGERAIAALEEAGAQRVEVHLPLLEHALAIGVATIVAEARAMASYAYERAPGAHGADLQVLLNAAAHMDAGLYLTAQGLRERLRLQVAAVLRDVDLLALPTTAAPAPSVHETEEKTGRMDAAGVAAMTRHCFMANLTGLPAGTAPVGKDADGLPLAVQLVGDAWDEHSVLSAMAQLERVGVAAPLRPPHHAELARAPR